MDKYEYKVKADEIKELIAEGEYGLAADIADGIDWRRVKSVMMLCTISDLYKINKRYDDAKNMLLLAYDRRPGGRMICYSLCELCIKTGDLVQALNSYREFVQVAPRDSGRYILQYKLYVAQDVGLKERIGVLEELKKRDYREKWAYELACLYHKAQLGARCVEECDELIACFGYGRYVIKAMELKMQYQPLSPAQQETYDHRFDADGRGGQEAAQAEQYEGQEVGASGHGYAGEGGYAPEGGYVSEDGYAGGGGYVSEESYAGAGGFEPGEVYGEGGYAQEGYGAAEDRRLQEEYGTGDGYTRQNYGSGAYDGREDFAQGGYGGGSYTQDNYDVEEGYRPAGNDGQASEDDLDIQVKTVDVGRFNTINLQAELAAGLQEVLGAENIDFTREEQRTKEDELQGDKNVDSFAGGMEEPKTGIAKVESIEGASVEAEEAGEGETQEEDISWQEEDAQGDEVWQEEDTQKDGAWQEGEEDVSWQEEDDQGDEVWQEGEGDVSWQEEDTQGDAAWQEEDAQKDGAWQEGEEDVSWQEEDTQGDAAWQEEDAQKDAAWQEGEEDISWQEEDAQGDEVWQEGEEDVSWQETEDGEKDEKFHDRTAERVMEQLRLEHTGEIPVQTSGKSPQPGKAPQSSESPQPGKAPQSSESPQPGKIPQPSEASQPGKTPQPSESPQPGKAPQPSESPQPGRVQQSSESPQPGRFQQSSESPQPGKILQMPKAPVVEEIPAEAPPKELAGVLSQESDGQIGFVLPERNVLEKQITGQMKIEDILAEWERTKKANEEKCREEIRQSVLRNTGPMFTEFEEAVRDGLLEQLEGSREGEAPREEIEEVAQDEVVSMEEIAEFEELEEFWESDGQENNSGEETVSEEPAPGKEPETKTVQKKRLRGKAEKKPEEQKNSDHVTEEEAEEEDIPVDEQEPVECEREKIRGLSREEKELYAPFVQSRQSREQLVKAIDSISMAAYTGNIVITGDEGMDTMTLAKNMIREVKMTDRNFSGKVAKITGQGLNQKNVKETLEELNNGALIIQDAAGMSQRTASALYCALQQERTGIIIAMEDTKKAMKKLFLGTPELYGCFTARIDLEAFSNDTLVSFGRRYAREMEYSIDDLGVLALHTRIEELQTIDHVVTVIEVKKIVDEAIRHAKRKTLGHFLDVLLAKRYDDEDMIILTEKDFVA